MAIDRVEQARVAAMAVINVEKRFEKTGGASRRRSARVSPRELDERPALAIEARNLRTAKIVAAFCALASAVYAVADADPSPIVALFLTGGPLILVILWLQHDASRTGIAAVHDLGLFLWLAWPFMIPWYVWKTRSWAGWRLCFGLLALIGAAYIGGLVGGLVAYLVRSAAP